LLLIVTGLGCGSDVPSEVTENLHRLATSAESYYQTEDAHFPAPSVGPTPLVGDCCTQGGLCPPNEAQWNGDPTWSALAFSITVPSPFNYFYDVSDNPGATDGSNQFTASAWGDLDCDGLYSTFALTGVAGESGVTISEITAHRADE
jgi:hypothetical protein